MSDQSGRKGGGWGGDRATGRPIHIPPREVNTQPSEFEPSKSYEDTSYLEDDYYMSVSETFHQQRGDVTLIAPPSRAADSPGASVATARTSSTGKRQKNRRPQLPRKNVQSFDDARAYQKSMSGGAEMEGESWSSLVPSPESCPDLSSSYPFSPAKRSGLAEALASVPSGEVVDGDSAAGLHTNEKPRKVKSIERAEADDEDERSRVIQSPKPKKAFTSEARKQARLQAKKRSQARKHRRDALSGTHEFGRATVGSDEEVEYLARARTSPMDVIDGESVDNDGNSGGNIKERHFRCKMRCGKKNLELKIPVWKICAPPLGTKLTKLSLRGNELKHLPDLIVQSLHSLRSMDLQQCSLVSLPEEWNMPHLRRLDLSHNCLTTFLSATALSGLPVVEHLDMSNNSIYDFSLPGTDSDKSNLSVLGSLKFMDLSFNDISYLPDGLITLQKLRRFRATHNFITHVSEKICRMGLAELTVAPNPLIQPPPGDCEQGISSMRRYYNGLNRKERRLSRKASRGGSPATTSLRASKMLIRDARRGMAKLNMGHVDTNRASKASDGQVIPANEVRRPKYQSRPVPLPATPFPSPAVATLPLKSPASTPPVHLFAKGDGTPTRVESDTSTISSLISADGDIVDGDVLNDTLKIIVVGMSCSGKTTVVNRLIHGMMAKLPKRSERTIGIKIDAWNPKSNIFGSNIGIEPSHFDTTIVQEDTVSGPETDVQFSIWDFAGQDVYHATHEIFFSPAALYVVVWDMAASNEECSQGPQEKVDHGAFQWEDSSDEENIGHSFEEDSKRADRALEHDIDVKVQYWVDCIRASVPGAVILPVATHDDRFADIGGVSEARRRCRMMKDRLLRREERRISSLQIRLSKLEDDSRAHTATAIRLKHLLSPYRLPKLIFEEDGSPDAVLRVSGKVDTGFDALRGKIINIATGRYTAGMEYPLFRGHVGAVVPPMRLKVRDLVREKRAKLQLVEWEHFCSMVEEELAISVDEDALSDTLRFLSRTGEISFFGGEGEIVSDRSHIASSRFNDDIFYDSSDDEYEGLEQNQMPLKKSQSPPVSVLKRSGLSHFIFINPLWLAVTLKCILRHDLKQQLDEVREARLQTSPADSRWDEYGRGDNFHDAALRCPIIRSSDAILLWQSNSKLAKSAKKATADISSDQVTAFQFCERLLVHFGVLVPINMGMDEVLLNGENVSSSSDGKGSFYFLPSQLRPFEGKSEEIWTYKSVSAGTICLCQSWLFRGGEPPGMFERLTASILRSLYRATTSSNRRAESRGGALSDGQLSFHRILCFKDAFKISLGKAFTDVDGDLNETFVEIWGRMERQDSPSCIAGDSTGVGLRRLVISAKGQAYNGARNLWEGGYDLVLREAGQVIREYRGLDYTKQAVCSTCLGTMDVRRASLWPWSQIEDAIGGRSANICCENGHDVDIRFLAGKSAHTSKFNVSREPEQDNTVVPYSNLCSGIVFVGLWDGERVVNAGCGFVVDGVHGFIVTAAHILMDMSAAKEPIDSWKRLKARYYGREGARALVGVITDHREEVDADSPVGPEASFRYFADIVAEDIENMDACVLRISARLQTDVDNPDDCNLQPLEAPQLCDERNEPILRELVPSTRCELEEQIRLLGFSRGERALEVTQGFVILKHRSPDLRQPSSDLGHRPRYEIGINAPLTFVGQSGSPCVNRAGQVVGILSRADPADKNRCYLVPTREYLQLVDIARGWED